MAERKSQLAQAEAEERERKVQEQAEQRSQANTPEQRIRIWERVHQVALPREANHPLVKVIAERTGLSVAEVAAEQLRRGPMTTDRKAALSWNTRRFR